MKSAFSSNSILSLLLSFFAASVAFSQPYEPQMKLNVATPENLSEFELIAPPLTAKELADVSQTEKMEQSGELFELGEMLLNAPKKVLTLGQSPNVIIEIFQNARSIGKQFMIARHFGKIRYVFAVSGGKGLSTPGGTYGVSRSGASSSGQRWRHMSLTYPSAGENNMDHVTYFKPAIGFHSTVFGLYSNLGRADSHGCVRLARPEARAIYTLIKNNGSAATIISRKSGDPHPAEIQLVRTQLARDLNFIQNLLRTRNRADVPFTEAEYMSYRNGTMPRNVLKEILRRAGIKEITEITKDMDLGSGGPTP